MIYDCFQMFNELDILKLRLNVMDPVVDRFVISEANVTYSGQPKPYYFEEHRDEFAQFADKIIHVTVTDTPSGYTHDCDTFQKNAVARGLKVCSDDDIIIFSDIDEIPDPEKVRDICKKMQDNKNGELNNIYQLVQRMFYCYLNMEEVSGNLLACCGDFPDIKDKKWIGTKICSWKTARKMSLGDLRWSKVRPTDIRVDNAGWHFGYMGGSGEKDVKKRVAEKVKAAAHQEFNNRDTLSQTEDLIDDGKDIFGREAQFRIVPIDDTYPKYLRDHISEYAYLIKKPDSQLAKVLRHIRMKARRIVRRLARGIRRCLHLAQ